jgi:hypothetical protein
VAPQQVLTFAPRGAGEAHDSGTLDAYWTQESLDELLTVDDYPELRSLDVPPGTYLCARTNRMRETVARSARGNPFPTSPRLYVSAPGLSLAPLELLEGGQRFRRDPADEVMLRSLNSSVTEPRRMRARHHYSWCVCAPTPEMLVYEPRPFCSAACSLFSLAACVSSMIVAVVVVVVSAKQISNYLFFFLPVVNASTTLYLQPHCFSSPTRPHRAKKKFHAFHSLSSPSSPTCTHCANRVFTHSYSRIHHLCFCIHRVRPQQTFLLL